MLNYQNKIKVMFIFILILEDITLIANEFKYEFQFIKILEHGKKKKFTVNDIDIKEVINNFTVEEDNDARYPFYIKLSKKDIGKQIKLEIANNKNWVMLSPSKGSLTISKNMKAKIEILLVRKYTEIYYDIFGNYEYSVQVFYTESKKKALQLRDDLIKDKYKAYYEVVPIVPNKGYMYKVKVGNFSTIKEAKEEKNKINQWYPIKLQGSFITARMK